MERIVLKTFYHLNHEVMNKVTEYHCVYYHCMPRKSIGVNNALVLKLTPKNIYTIREENSASKYITQTIVVMCGPLVINKIIMK